MIQSRLLEKISGLRHGFGTKDAVYPEPRPWLPKQIHSDRWYELAPAGDLPSSLQVEADAVVTSRPDQAIGVRTADCVPILMSAVDQGLVAAVHAGRKGTAAGITVQFVSWLASEKGIAVDQLYVAMGPCIQSCCYEVDLVAANREQLLAAGVRVECMDHVDRCTRCDAELFHSYRRDREAAGRQISWIELTPR